MREPIQSEGLNPQEILAILKRRFWAFFIPFVSLVVIAVPVVFLLPPVYRSTATILIEDQDIPRDLVRSTVNTFANERLEVITRRVTTTRNLVSLIRRRKLYMDLRSKETLAALAKRARKSFSLKILEANVINGRSGRTSRATIAFNLSFEHRNPSIAQAVVNDFVSLYISANLRTRRKKAEETKQFLEQEVEKAANQISNIETNLARFKQANAGNLPEQASLINAQLGRAEGRLLSLSSRLGILRGRSISLKAELAQLAPSSSPRGRRLSILTGRLGQLRAELGRLRSRYGKQHPDVVRAVRQIRDLAGEVARASRRQARLERSARELGKVKLDLAKAKKELKADDPKVVELQKRANKLTKTLRAGGYFEENTLRGRNPANLTMIKLRAELAATNTEIAALSSQMKAVRQKIVVLERRLNGAPQIEREYLLLKRNLANAVADFRGLSVKLREARLGAVLELSRKAERFSLIEPATRPSEPVSPNRPAYLLVSVVFAAVLGGMVVFLLETLDQSIRSSKQLAGIVGSVPLVIIPNIVSPFQRRRQRRKRIIYAGSSIALLLLFGVAGYLGVVGTNGPLRNILTKIERQVGG